MVETRGWLREKLDVALLRVNFEHVKYEVDQLFVHDSQHNALVMETQPLKPVLHAFNSRGVPRLLRWRTHCVKYSCTHNRLENLVIRSYIKTDWWSWVGGIALCLLLELLKTDIFRRAFEEISIIQRMAFDQWLQLALLVLLEVLRWLMLITCKFSEHFIPSVFVRVH